MRPPAVERPEQLLEVWNHHRQGGSSFNSFEPLSYPEYEYYHDHNQVFSERWRYIRYADSSEELYDHRRAPKEWTNLARDPRYSKLIAEHRRWLPKVTAPPVPGSAARLLVNENGVWVWEGKAIRKEDKEP